MKYLALFSITSCLVSLLVWWLAVRKAKWIDEQQQPHHGADEGVVDYD